MKTKEEIREADRLNKRKRRMLPEVREKEKAYQHKYYLKHKKKLSTVEEV
jgi:hypothetical protein